MRLLLILNIFWTIWNFLNRFSEINNNIDSAEKNYKKGEYEFAIRDYTLLTTKYGIKDENILLDLAHSYYNINDTANSKKIYQQLLNSSNNVTRSIAYQQLGNIYWSQGKKNKAVTHYTEALKANAFNETARINFELVQKLIKLENQFQTGVKYRKEKQASGEGNTGKSSGKSQAGTTHSLRQSDENDNGSSRAANEGGTLEGRGTGYDQSKNELRNEKNGNKENEDLISNRLKSANLSLQKARAILDAMKKNEIQYLQQQQKVQTRAADEDLPDW